MILFDSVTITYDGAAAPTLRDVDLRLDDGELCLVVGPTGCGKSTLLGAINAHVPRFTGGRLHGRVVVAGRDTSRHHPRDLADVVGVVGQDPLAGFVTGTVESELAFGMEQMGLSPVQMRQRVEEVLDLLSLADLRHRSLRTLSGGQQQRVAIGAVLTLNPGVLVLDEPTSALDPVSAEEVLGAITRLVHDLGVTAVVAEHRLERILPMADRLIEIDIQGHVRYGDPVTMMRDAAVAPPVVHLSRLAGWEPVPLSVRDARRAAGGLRRRLAAADWTTPQTDTSDGVADSVGTSRMSRGTGAAGVRPVLQARAVTVTYGATVAVAATDLELHAGEVVGLMGRNGSGKSSLLWALQGSGPRAAGRVLVGQADPAHRGAIDARRAVGLVPQTPSDLLYLPSVAEECARADGDAQAPHGTCRDLLHLLAPGVDERSHPRDLSEGQRLALVLALTLTARPRVLLLDEPTRGLDYRAKAALSQALHRCAAEGLAVMVSTHDVEFVAGTCTRVVVLAEGDVVADGPTEEVVVASPTLAPQVAKILRPGPWLTVDQVRHALAADTAETAGTA